MHQLGNNRLRFGAAPPHEHVVEDQPERIDVGTMIDGLGRRRLLGGHVIQRTDDPSGDV